MESSTTTDHSSNDSGKTQDQLKLLGNWASSYTHRVQLALKLKGVEFEYVEEDLANKSSSLLLYNPVHKKVPVLLHAGRPLAESVVILQYIDETWKDPNPIMPHAPYDRAVMRFWCHFSDDKLAPAVAGVFRSSGEEQKAAVAQVHENLKLLEEELRDGFFKGRRFFGGESLGLLDLVVGCGSYWLSVLEEVSDQEISLVDADAFPRFHAWLRDFEAQPEVKQIIPPADRLLDYARGIRQYYMLSSASSSDHDHISSGTDPAGDINSKDVESSEKNTATALDEDKNDSGS